MMKILQISFILVLGMLLNQVHAQAPVITQLSPTDNAEGVSPQVNLMITFDMPVQKGEGTLEIRQVHDDALVEAIDVGNSRVTLSETAESVTVNPTNNFSYSTSYYIQMSVGAFENLSDEPFAGIQSKTVWNFSTGCSSAPVTLQPGFVSSSFVVLQWEGVPEISEYQIWVSGKGTFNITDGSNELLLTALVPGTTYSWYIKSVCKGDGITTFSVPSDRVTFKTSGTNPCSALPSVQPTTNITDNSVRLNWSAKAGVSDYQVWISGQGTFYSNGLNYIDITGLSAGSTYSFNIKARCSDSGNTTFSPGVSGEFSTTGTNPCNADVSNLTSTTEDNSALLQWAAIPGVTDYQLWISGIGTITSTGGQNSYLLEGLAAGSTYSWRVKSKCQSTGTTIFSSIASSEFETTGTNICAESPQNLIVSNVETNSVTLGWDDTGASDYQILVSGVGYIVSTGGQNSYELEGLAPGSIYTWSVASRCKFTGKTIFSEYASGEFMTAGENVCAQSPENLNAITIGNNAAILEWDDTGASDYQLWISGIGTIYTTGGQNSYPVEGLVAGTMYSWSVRSKCQWTGKTTFSPYSSGEFITPQPLVAEESDQPGTAPEEKLAEEEVATQEERLNVISLHPNPSDDFVTVAVEGNDRINSIIIFNSKGEALKEIDDLNSTSEIISLRTYGSGIYLIRVVINNNQMVTERAIIL